MEKTDFHLYLLFTLEKQYFGVNIHHVKQLLRLKEGTQQTGYIVINEEVSTQTLSNMLDLKESLFETGKAIPSENDKNYFQPHLPTMIELISPVLNSTEHTMGIIVDFIIGLQQIPPEDINNTEPGQNHNSTDKRFITGYYMTPIMDRRGQLKETMVSLIHLENLFARGVKMKMDKAS